MADGANTKTFPLGYPFDFRGVSYREFTARRPKVRDLREFIRTVDKDGIKAVERVLSNLFEVEEAVVAEIDIEDFAPMRRWFDDFLKPMLNESPGS